MGSTQANGGVSTLKCYRVWMQDGTASLHDATSEDDAKSKAIQSARKNFEDACEAGLHSTYTEAHASLTVERVECLD